eukprot:scaffold1605_cov340-Prasinococcus_capsulatus_cf.AAC.7
MPAGTSTQTYALIVRDSRKCQDRCTAHARVPTAHEVEGRQDDCARWTTYSHGDQRWHSLMLFASTDAACLYPPCKQPLVRMPGSLLDAYLGVHTTVQWPGDGGRCMQAMATVQARPRTEATPL